MSITEEQVDTLCRVAYKQTKIKKGEVLIQEGDLFADKFYIVDSGSFSFHVKKQYAENETDRVGFVGTAKEGSSFGELALLYHAPRA